MSKGRFLGTAIDRVFLSSERRPDFRVYLWNPNRTTVNDVVLEQATSPRYDITHWVNTCSVDENLVFENSDDAVATNARLELRRDEDAEPIEITERTLIDGAPIRIVQGDESVPENQWVPIFTGVVRGAPSMLEETRLENAVETMSVVAVDRAEFYLNQVVTARAYEQGIDIGKAVVETAIERMNLDRREIKIGTQGYAIGHETSQLVDIEVLKGIAQMLFTVGKKPKFDSDGFLVAADTDLSRVPSRVIPDDLIVEIQRQQRGSAINNSVRLVGLSNELTKVVESVKRLAHGDITSGWFESIVRKEIFFSENAGKAQGGRRARNTFEKVDFGVFGDVGGGLRWRPFVEDDGETVFGGELKFDTGYSPWVLAAISVTYLGLKYLENFWRDLASDVPIGPVRETLERAANRASIGAALALVGLIIAMQSLGRVEWEIFGEPLQYVFKQLVAIAQLETPNGTLRSEEIREIEIRNDWLYEIAYMRTFAKTLLDRELVKGHSYNLTVFDDALIEVDDLIEADGREYYVTSIRRTLTRESLPRPQMRLTCWRLT